MEVLKIRCWDKEMNEFYYFDLINQSIKDLEVDPSKSDAVDLYTGYVDQDNKEIYTKDIVFSAWGYGNPKTIVRMDDIHYADGESLFLKEDIKIIGNVHQNPNLI